MSAGVERAPDVQRGEPPLVGPLPHVAVQLGRQHRLLTAPAALREPVAHDPLGGALALIAAVDVGGVEEVDALLMRGVHDRERVGLGGEGAEVHGAQAQTADTESGSPELREVHVSTLPRTSKERSHSMLGT